MPTEQMTEETPERPPVRRVVLRLLAECGVVSGPLLVQMTHAETGGAAWMIRATLQRMERHGAIYNVSGDPDAPRWKVTYEQ